MRIRCAIVLCCVLSLWLSDGPSVAADVETQTPMRMGVPTLGFKAALARGIAQLDPQILKQRASLSVTSSPEERQSIAQGLMLLQARRRALAAPLLRLIGPQRAPNADTLVVVESAGQLGERASA